MNHFIKSFTRVIFVVLIFSLFVNVCFADNNDERVRLGIMKFSNHAFNLDDKAAGSISNLFASALFKFKTIRVIERERLEEVGKELGLGASGLVDESTAAEIGKVAGCQYILLGAITNLSSNTESRGFGGLYAKKIHNVRADLNIRIIDVSNSEIIFADEVTGNAQTSASGFDVGGISQVKEGFSGLEGEAIKNAVNAMAPRIEKAIVVTKDDDENNDEFLALTEGLTPNDDSATARKAVKKNNNFENKSTDPAKVINSYEIDQNIKNSLISRHKDASKKYSKEGKLEAYEAIFKYYDGDYLAAYYAGLAEFDMGHGSRSMDWCNKALEINPRYLPAKQLLKRARGLEKGI